MYGPRFAIIESQSRTHRMIIVAGAVGEFVRHLPMTLRRILCSQFVCLTCRSFGGVPETCDRGVYMAQLLGESHGVCYCAPANLEPLGVMTPGHHQYQ